MVRLTSYVTSQLNCAAEKGHLGVSALLMQRGANTRAMDSYLRTPIMNACAKQHLLCVQALLPHADLAHLNKYPGWPIRGFGLRSRYATLRYVEAA